MAGRMPFCNHRTAYCPHTTPAEADSSTFSPIQDILMANQVFSTHSAHSIPHPQQKPLTGSKTPRRHTAQQPPKTRPTRPKHPLTST
ncbi:MAG: hypothetical protein MR898_07520 [Prevotella sp.]|nr:hypothetical protein [Prevotella sp.]